MSWITDEIEGMVLPEQSQILHQQRITVLSSLPTSGDGRPASIGDASATSASSDSKLAPTAPPRPKETDGNTRKAYDERPNNNSVHHPRENTNIGSYQFRTPPGLSHGSWQAWTNAPENEPRVATTPRYPPVDDEKQAANFAEFIDLAGWDAVGPGGGAQTTTSAVTSAPGFAQGPITTALPSFGAAPPSRSGPFFPTAPRPPNQQPPPPPPPYLPQHFGYPLPQLVGYPDDAGAYDQYLANLASVPLPYLSPAAITPNLTPAMQVSPHFTAVATTGAVFPPPQAQAPPPGISATFNVQVSGYFPPIRPPNLPAYPYFPPIRPPNTAMYPYIERTSNGDQIGYAPPLPPRAPPPPPPGVFWTPWSTPTTEPVGNLPPDSFTWNPTEMAPRRLFSGSFSTSTSPAEATIQTTPSTDSQQPSPAFWPESIVPTPVFASAENVTTELSQMQTMSIGSGKPAAAVVARVGGESSVESEWSATVTTAQTTLNGASPSGEKYVSSASPGAVVVEEVGSGAKVRLTRRGKGGGGARGRSKGRAGAAVKGGKEKDHKVHGKVHGRTEAAATRVTGSEETMRGDEDEEEEAKVEEEDEDDIDAAAIKRRKNTLAARRSRARKQQRQSELETMVRELEGRNSELVQHLATLETERRRWMEGQDAHQKRIRELEDQLMAAQEWVDPQQQQQQQGGSGSGNISGTTPRQEGTAERVRDWVLSSAVKTERESVRSRGSGSDGEEGGVVGFGSLVVPWGQNGGKGREPDVAREESGELVPRSQS
ncbi:hypothetical protein BJ742DRAFT_741947 [Cladochytrium replicatum]|nr:hypothetical protein BJ742DRAFT_741947 [Cladochytrium replicatum]